MNSPDQYRSGAWDADSIGDYSVTMGLNTKASGLFSMAMGYNTTASGYTSTAMGISTLHGHKLNF